MNAVTQVECPRPAGSKFFDRESVDLRFAYGEGNRIRSIGEKDGAVELRMSREC